MLREPDRGDRSPSRQRHAAKSTIGPSTNGDHRTEAIPFRYKLRPISLIGFAFIAQPRPHLVTKVAVKLANDCFQPM